MIIDWLKWKQIVRYSATTKTLYNHIPHYPLSSCQSPPLLFAFADPHALFDALILIHHWKVNSKSEFAMLIFAMKSAAVVFIWIWVSPFLYVPPFFGFKQSRQDRYSAVRTRTVLTYTHNHNHTHTHTWHTFFPPPHTHTYSHANAYIQNDTGLSDTACAAEKNLESKKKQVPWWERRNIRSKRCARSWPTRNLKFQRRPID